MGGDHKCPVCQATFTRPQHVARHMRSHTGDRPYKCQYCGDQFARSDLLSRHVNKCHASEKPLPAQGSRRKGSASASRATTSKQACDQCVQSSLPCDGSNPCAKCVQRKCRCTYVKFHRQTAPIGPGHNPRPNLPPNGLSGPPSAISSSRIPISYSPDEFFLAPAPTSVPTMAESLYSSSGFSFPPLYPEPASAPGVDFTSKYRAQAELLRSGSSSAHFAPTGGTDKDNSATGSSMSHNNRSHQQGYLNSHATVPHGLQHSPSSGAGDSYPSSSHHPTTSTSSAAYLRRGSVEFSSDPSVSTGEHSLPSSAASSNVHLPLNGLPPMPYNVSISTTIPLENLSGTDVHRGHQTSTTSINQPHHQHSTSGLHGGEAQVQNPGVSSAFGLLSLDDSNLLSGLDDSAPSFFPPPGMNLSASNMNMPLTGLSGTTISGIPADDPDATPMPLKETTTSANASSSSSSLPARSSSTSGSGNNANPREGDLRELREFWKQYMRTPLSGPGPAEGGGPAPPTSATPSSSQQQQSMSPPGFRRPRVASMPSSKTPTIAVSLQQHQQGGGGESGVRTTLNEDLKSYEAAVNARKAPTNLNLVPKMRRGTVPALPPLHHHALHHIVSGKAVGVVPLVNLDLLGGGPLGTSSPRPSSSSTNRSDGSGSSSLAGRQFYEEEWEWGREEGDGPSATKRQFLVPPGSGDEMSSIGIPSSGVEGLGHTELSGLGMEGFAPGALGMH
ncbi:Zinc finger and BTB domain-containing protein 8B [Leucoagaricus sp. SymC.cos]|nr:Zinc finger and BTB domain-containing protein 8B [Leucoagaricus sp. SymC.cos]